MSCTTPAVCKHITAQTIDRAAEPLRSSAAAPHAVSAQQGLPQAQLRSMHIPIAQPNHQQVIMTLHYGQVVSQILEHMQLHVQVSL